MINPQQTIHSPFSSIVIGMAHLMDFAAVLTNRRNGKEQDLEALKDDWRSVGSDLRQAIHLYERLEQRRRK